MAALPQINFSISCISNKNRKEDFSFPAVRLIIKFIWKSNMGTSLTRY